MTLLAGRMTSLHSYSEDVNTQGILKNRPTQRTNKSEVKLWQSNKGQRNDDGKRLVRFCEENESEEEYKSERNSTKESQDVIKFGNSMYVIDSSNPNSAVSKLFPNAKLTPINPFVNRSVIKERISSLPLIPNSYENNYYLANRTNLKSDNERETGRNTAVKRVDRNPLRRTITKTVPETNLKSNKGNNAATPLIERIKQLTCEEYSCNGIKAEKGHSKFENNSGKNLEVTRHFNKKETQVKEPNAHLKSTETPKQAKEGLDLLQYSKNVTSPRKSQSIGLDQKVTSPSRTDAARQTFLSSLAQLSVVTPGDRNSVSTNSSTADTVYSLSDIEEALTEEEKEIKEAFSQENKQDELELFVQQDAGRTERLRKRYSSTPKLETHISGNFSNISYPKKSQNSNLPYFLKDSYSFQKDKPKFGSTIEILQQLQQQIEIPYQLEGRRTACSNYSDSSIPISDRLFYDESSDGYEPVVPKTFVQRTCSLDSKNYEEIDSFPSAFSVPRTKSQEHPRLTHLDSDPYMYAPAPMRHSSSYIQRNQMLEQGLYTSSPDLHGYHLSMFPDRVSAYNNHTTPGKQLHPVLQRQYCRYPASEVYSSPAEEGKVLTPPIRMHTYMNIPNNAPCYISPPPYTNVKNYMRPPSYNEIYNYNSPLTQSNIIYQNIPLSSSSPNMMTIRRLCTERERGVPEGASTSDPKEIYTNTSKDIYHSNNLKLMPKSPSFPQQYCVDV